MIDEGNNRPDSVASPDMLRSVNVPDELDNIARME
jgi:hypothetical protein